MMKICPAHIDLPSPVEECIKYVWSIFCYHFEATPSFSHEINSIKINCRQDADIQISQNFVNTICQKKYKQSDVFIDQPIMYCENGKPDYLGSSFYLLNYLQEFNATKEEMDDYGRFSYHSSYQARFDCAHDDLVSSYFEKISQNITAFESKSLPKPSRVFLSHDIDTITASLLHEGKAAVVKKDIALVLKVILKHVLNGPSYRNMDRIMDIHDQYDAKSTFFWLVKKGKYQSPYTEKPIPHSDYRIDNKVIQQIQRRIVDRGFENGLHKSASRTSFNNEINDLAEKVLGNRNHYLFVRMPDHFAAIEKSKILLDFSMGFGRMYGHRNSYARPFIPYSMKNNTNYSFLEVPLQLMDTTFKFYQKRSAKQTEKLILDFMEKHRFNSVISILWHNDMFSPVKNPQWLKLYKSILDYLRQNQLRSITQKELLTERASMLTSFHNSFS
ncbi:MAG: hypothetical protein KDC53_10410 [Saprospiraceae bacterium]|nr:hypothetical protein [Saprospiraceae bacterium]